MESKIINKELFIIDDKVECQYEIQRKSLSYWKDVWRRLKKNKLAIISLFILGLIIIMAAIGPKLQPYDFDEQNMDLINKGPSSEHLFGTDELGRDIFVRVWYGARISLTIAVFSAGINLVIGTLYGGFAGYKGGSIDNIMMRIIDIIYSVPEMIWIILLMVVVGPGLKTMIIVFAIVGWGGMARLVRGQVLQIREMEFIQAAKVFGASTRRIIMKHLLPNCIGPIIVSLTFSIPSAIYTEAFLSYIGLGVPIPLASWGTLSNDGAKLLLAHPYQLLFPSLMICITIFAFNILGDALRDTMDPRMKD